MLKKKRVLWDFCSLIPKRNQTCLDCCIHVAFLQASPTWSNKQAGNSPQKSFQHPFKNALTPCTLASIYQSNSIRRQHQIEKKLSGTGHRDPLWSPQAFSAEGDCGTSWQLALARVQAAQEDVPACIPAGRLWEQQPRSHPTGAHTALLQPQLHSQGLVPAPDHVKQGCNLGVGFFNSCSLVILKLLLTRGVRAGCGERHFPFRQETVKVQTSLVPAH